MTKKKDPGPSTFFEWVVGTTVHSATRHKNQTPKPPSRRDMVRIELSTDDEEETDSLRVTYPRSSRGTPTAIAKQGGKKVRFDEQQPRKSAMKKTTTTVTEVETDTEESGDESEDEKKKDKTVKKKVVVETSEDEDEPHPTCKCTDCIRARQKAKRQHQSQNQCIKKQNKKQVAADSEDSESDLPVKQGKKKGKKAEPESDADSSADESESETENKKASKKDKQQKGGKKDKTKPVEDSEEEDKPTKKEKKLQKNNDKNEANSSKKRQQQKENVAKKGNYPEGLPDAHPRRPNYIEPIRAEVVQTERVIEGPEDPKPNAYYDAEHNIIRVYHGPVYGGNHNQGLYPKRDPNGRPLPMGAVHPSQNPWFYGFKDGQGEGYGAANVPVTQGMPMNAMYPPGPYGYPPMGYPPGAPPPMHEGGWNKGAFAHMSGANGPGEKDKSATNNVGPGSVKPQSLEGENNPYYQHHKSGLRSKFSDWGSNKNGKGSNKAASWGNKSGSNKGGSNNGNAWGGNNGSNNGDTWGHGNINTSGSYNGEPAQLSGQQDSFPMDTTWESASKNGQNDGAADSWGAKNNDAPAEDWGNANQTSNTDTWGVSASGNDWNAPQQSPTKEENNVAPVETMPGSWDSKPSWADPTAAAATGGAVDNEVDDVLPTGGW